jgi:hypothetical protein
MLKRDGYISRMTTTPLFVDPKIVVEAARLFITAV